MAITRTENNSHESQGFAQGESGSRNTTTNSTEHVKSSSSFNVLPNKEINKQNLIPKVGAVIHDSLNGKNEYWNGSLWVSEGGGALSDNFGFVDYNDNTGSINLVSDTWTDVPNNKQGAFTNIAYAPNGVTNLMDGNTGYLDFSELTLGSDVLIRIDFSVTPNTNNSLLETRYVLGQGADEYVLPVRSRRLDSGSGIPYSSEKGSFYIYMGDNNTLGGVGKLQVRLSTIGTLTNSGVAIKIYKK